MIATSENFTDGHWSDAITGKSFWKGSETHTKINGHWVANKDLKSYPGSVSGFIDACNYAGVTGYYSSVNGQVVKIDLDGMGVVYLDGFKGDDWMPVGRGSAYEVEVLEEKSDYSYWDAFTYLWNIRALGRDVPDNISIELNLGVVSIGGASNTYTLNILTRGDAGFYVTRTEQQRVGAEVDCGLNINFGRYLGDPFEINKSTLLGPIKSLSGGYGWGLGISAGYKSQYSNYLDPIWINIGSGFGITSGVSYGWGITWPSWNK